MAFVGILSQIKLLSGPLVIQLVGYILKQLFTSVSVKEVDIYLAVKAFSDRTPPEKNHTPESLSVVDHPGYGRGRSGTGVFGFKMADQRWRWEYPHGPSPTEESLKLRVWSILTT